MSKTIQNRVAGLDALKALCAFLVITIHANFQGIIGPYFDALARVAVPIFFMITGFFYCDTQKNGRDKLQIKKIAILCIEANLLYFLWEITIHLKSGVKEYILSCITLEAIINFLFFNESQFRPHLWYLSAMLYVLIIVYFLNKRFGAKAKHYLYISVPFLLLVNSAFGAYSGVILGKTFLNFFVRNFAFTGIPYFSIGLFIREHNSLHLTKLQIITGILLFSATTILEKYLLSNYLVSATHEHYISTVFTSVLLFILFQGYIENNGTKLLQSIGRRHSTMVYIIHPILIDIFDKLSRAAHIETQYFVIRPFVVFAASLLASVMWKYLLCFNRK